MVFSLVPLRAWLSFRGISVDRDQPRLPGGSVDQAEEISVGIRHPEVLYHAQDLRDSIEIVIKSFRAGQEHIRQGVC